VIVSNITYVNPLSELYILQLEFKKSHVPLLVDIILYKQSEAILIYVFTF